MCVKNSVLSNAVNGVFFLCWCCRYYCYCLVSSNFKQFHSLLWQAMALVSGIDAVLIISTHFFTQFSGYSSPLFISLWRPFGVVLCETPKNEFSIQFKLIFDFSSSHSFQFHKKMLLSILQLTKYHNFVVCSDWTDWLSSFQPTIVVFNTTSIYYRMLCNPRKMVERMFQSEKNSAHNNEC